MGNCRFGIEELTAIGKAVFGDINNTEYVRTVRGHAALNRQVPCGSGPPN